MPFTPADWKMGEVDSPEEKKENPTPAEESEKEEKPRGRKKSS